MSPERRKISFEIPGVPHLLLAAGINIMLVLILAVGIAGLLYLVQLTSSVTVPLIIAIVVGMISYPLVRLGDRVKLPRAVSALVVIALVIALVWMAIALTVSGVIDQGPAIVEQTVAGLESLRDGLNDLLHRGGFSGDVNDLVDELLDSATKAVVGEPAAGDGEPTSLSGAVVALLFNGGAIFTALEGFLGGSQVASAFGQVFGFLFSLFIGITLLYYILSDYDNVFEWIGAHLGVPNDVGRGLVVDATDSMRGYFRGTTISALAVALATGVALWILGVPLVIPIAIVTFLLGYIPYLGALVAGAFAVLIALGSQGLVAAVWVIVVSIVFNNVLQTIINARFLGESLDLHPIVVLVSTIIGSIFAGLLGATLGAPIAAMLVRMNRRLRDARSGVLGPAFEADLENAALVSGERDVEEGR